MKIFLTLSCYYVLAALPFSAGISWAEEPSQEWKDAMKRLEMIAEKETKNQKPRILNAGTDQFDVSFVSEPEKVTVHSLRPHDIDVIGALGDSISAGTGIDANTAAGIAIEFRGLTFSTGGDESLETSITLPNILRKFNPWLKGYAVGKGLFLNTRDEDWFNVAIPGARSWDLADQARDLLDRMKKDGRTSFENDWKLITVFIGGNDLCSLESSPRRTTPDKYRGFVKEALDILHDELPRALIQIVQIMEIYILSQIPSGVGASTLCPLVQRLECNYVVTAAQNSTTLQQLKDVNKEYQRQIEQLVSSGRYDTRDDFSVVLQPFFQDTVLPLTPNGEVDATYFAPDCFHLSSKGHAMGAINLWNNMLEPLGEKSTQWKVADLECPNEDVPHIFTSQNSFPDPVTSTNPVTCSTRKCNKTPDWAVGVLCGLAGFTLCELLLFMFVMRKKAPKVGMPTANHFEAF